MAWTQADLDVINAAIAIGAKRVRFQSHEVEYHSLGDLLRARDAIKGELESVGNSGGSIILVEYQSGA